MLTTTFGEGVNGVSTYNILSLEAKLALESPLFVLCKPLGGEVNITSITNNGKHEYPETTNSESSSETDQETAEFEVEIEACCGPSKCHSEAACDHKAFEATTAAFAWIFPRLGCL